MSSMRFALLVALTLFGGATLVPVVEAQKIPAPIKFPPGTGSPGAVTFSHETHKEANEKCTVCHTKIFKMKTGTSGPLTMKKMEAGEQCGACHNGTTEVKGKKVFAVTDGDKCQVCHKAQ